MKVEQPLNEQIGMARTEWISPGTKDLLGLAEVKTRVKKETLDYAGHCYPRDAPDAIVFLRALDLECGAPKIYEVHDADGKPYLYLRYRNGVALMCPVLRIGFEHFGQ